MKVLKIDEINLFISPNNITQGAHRKYGPILEKGSDSKIGKQFKGTNLLPQFNTYKQKLFQKMSYFEKQV